MKSEGAKRHIAFSDEKRGQGICRQKKLISPIVFCLLISSFIFLLVMSCDKWDCNGDLDGMWQLTEWRDNAGNTKATKKDMIFYSFQLQMASFRKNSGKKFFIRTSMEVTPEKIHIYDPIEYAGNGHDEVQPMSVLSLVGVPEDGILWVEVLTGSAMVLKTNNQDVLTFRKY